jgi:hypothetical protein
VKQISSLFTITSHKSLSPIRRLCFSARGGIFATLVRLLCACVPRACTPLPRYEKTCEEVSSFFFRLEAKNRRFSQIYKNTKLKLIMLQKLYFLLTNGGGDLSTGEENEGMISSSSDSRVYILKYCIYQLHDHLITTTATATTTTSTITTSRINIHFQNQLAKLSVLSSKLSQRHLVQTVASVVVAAVCARRVPSAIADPPRRTTR